MLDGKPLYRSADVIKTQVRMARDHFAAHIDFADFACFIEFEALKQVLRYLFSKQSLLDLPIHEVQAGVAGPKRSVTVEHGNPWLAGEDMFEKRLSGQGC